MRCKINTYNVGKGDCIFFHIEDGDNQFILMCDCGKLTKEVLTAIHDIFNNHIDLLIVTHIDSDHINGLTDLLKNHPEVTVSKIVYNCCQPSHVSEIKINNNQEQVMQYIANQLAVLEPVADMSAVGATSLASVILGNEKLRANRVSNDVLKGETLTLGEDGKFGSLTFLTPTQKAIRALDDEYKKLLVGYLYADEDDNYEGAESLYELLIRYADMVNNNEHKGYPISHTLLTADNIRVLANQDSPQGLSLSNKASLSFEWRCGDKRVLFLGDADPVDVTQTLKEQYGDEKQYYDAIKVSHHGSDYSIDNELLSMIDSGRYIFTGGQEKYRPGYLTLAKIISRAISGDIGYRNLYFNFPTRIIADFNEESLKEQFCYAIEVNKVGNEILL